MIQSVFPAIPTYSIFYVMEGNFVGEVSIGDEQFFAFNLGHTHLYGIYKGIEIEILSYCLKSSLTREPHVQLRYCMEQFSLAGI
ncbi:uncharacterized protein LOC110629368 isoform X2 [Manihot esculenta]|nr:uncharacterized protein LOC110629368 isoform X2 [Manihot esculenta]